MALIIERKQKVKDKHLMMENPRKKVDTLREKGKGEKRKKVVSRVGNARIANSTNDE